MDMNLANKLTMLRVVMIPAFLLVLFLAPEPMNRYIAVIIFIVASLTDMLDGKIARKYNMVSNFGKFMDPLADKLLVMSALVSMVALKDLAAWVVIVILAREFAITGFRTLAMEANIVGEGENHHADDYDSCAAAESAVCVHACSGKASGDSGGILYDFLRRGLYH